MIIGSEREGVHPEIAALADGTIRVPTTGWVESLNVVQAVATVSYFHYCLLLFNFPFYFYIYNIIVIIVVLMVLGCSENCGV